MVSRRIVDRVVVAEVKTHVRDERQPKREVRRRPFSGRHRHPAERTVTTEVDGRPGGHEAAELQAHGLRPVVSSPHDVAGVEPKVSGAGSGRRETRISGVAPEDGARIHRLISPLNPGDGERATDRQMIENLNSGRHVR